MSSGVRAGPGLGNAKNFCIPCSMNRSPVMIRSTESMRGDQVANSIFVSPLKPELAVSNYNPYSSAICNHHAGQYTKFG